jgi:hypothetical protein
MDRVRSTYGSEAERIQDIDGQASGNETATNM